MNLTILSTTVGLAAAAGLALALGGVRGTGVLAGFLTGVAVTGFGIVRQRRVLIAAPERALRTMVEGFLAKLAAVSLAVLAFVVVPPLRAVADWKSFLLAFAAAAFVVLLPGTIDNARILSGRRSP